MTKAVLFVVAAALVDADGRVLLAERPAGKDMAGLWEFPGGKVQPNETPEAALCRELDEELSLSFEPADWCALSFVSYPYEKFHLFMPLFGARIGQARPRPREGQKFLWLSPKDFSLYPLPPADKPLARFLERLGDLNSFLDATC